MKCERLPALLERALRTVSAAIATVSAAAATPATPARAAIFHRARFVDLDRTSVKLLAVEATDGRFALRAAAHGDERETARAIGGAIHHDFAIGDGAELLESVLKVDFGGLKREISNEKSHSDLIW
jgi:hypothetical protein